MKRYRLLAVVLGIALAWSLPVRAAEWLWLDSPHFEMLTDTDAATARKLLIELEQFRSVFLQFMDAEPEIGMRTTVVYFAAEKDFDRYKPQYNGKTKSVAGFFTGSEINGFMAVGRGANLADAKRVIYHEYAHALYHEVGWSPPLWLNEGTAEVFSTYEASKGVAHLGRAPVEHVQVLRGQGLVPLGRLLQVGLGSPDYNETRKQGMFYAESWVLSHYLICNRDPAWRAKLNAFMPNLTAGYVDEAAFRAGLGVGFGQMEKLLTDYIYGGSYLVFSVAVPEAGIAATLRVRPAAAEEREVVLQLLQALSRDASAADYQLILLAEKYPQSARVREAIAARALNAGDEARAKDYVQRALDLGTSNTRAYWYLGEQQLHSWLMRDIGPAKRLGAEDTAQLRELFHRVIKDCPRAIDAWEALARTEAFAPEPERAAVEKIVAFSATAPADPRVLQAKMLAAFAYKRLGETELARKLAGEVEAAPTVNPGTKAFNRVLLGDLLPPL
jgi:tetratricopeptide (TPR) repeat protein